MLFNVIPIMSILNAIAFECRVSSWRVRTPNVIYSLALSIACCVITYPSVDGPKKALAFSLDLRYCP